MMDDGVHADVDQNSVEIDNVDSLDSNTINKIKAEIAKNLKSKI